MRTEKPDTSWVRPGAGVVVFQEDVPLSPRRSRVSLVARSTFEVEGVGTRFRLSDLGSLDMSLGAPCLVRADSVEAAALWERKRRAEVCSRALGATRRWDTSGNRHDPVMVDAAIAALRAWRAELGRGTD